MSVLAAEVREGLIRGGKAYTQRNVIGNNSNIGTRPMLR